jgi:hypothetical protein
VRHRSQDGRLEPVQVAAPADQQPRSQERGHHGHQDGDPAERDPPAGCGERCEEQHDHIKEDRRIRRDVGQHQRNARSP